jgi:hypothetical protein
MASIDTCIFKYDTIAIYQWIVYPITDCKFIRNGTGIELFQGTIMQNCTLTNNNYGIRNALNSTIEYSTIDSNNIDGLTCLNDTIKNCNIEYNNVGISSDQDIVILNNISDNKIGIQGGDDKLVSCNTICNNTLYNIESEYSGNESVKNNYWCLPDSIHIQPTLYDAYQNIHLGFLYFTPFDTFCLCRCP